MQISSITKENSFLMGKYSKSNGSDNAGKMENENIKESASSKDDTAKMQYSKSFEESGIEESVNSVEVCSFN